MTSISSSGRSRQRRHERGGFSKPRNAFAHVVCMMKSASVRSAGPAVILALSPPPCCHRRARRTANPAFSVSAVAWKPVDWQVTPREQSWKNDLPRGLEASLLQSDSSSLQQLAAGNDSYSPAPSQPKDPSFIALTLFGTKAFVSGHYKRF